MAKKDYIQANKDWLAAKAAEEGVKPLPKGIYYKVLASGTGDGKHPTPRSIVTAHYTGWTINGKKFDSSRGGTPAAFRLSDLIEGWIIAIQQMCVGDKWEIYLPAELGYGQVLSARHTGWLHLDFRNRTAGHCLTIPFQPKKAVV